MKLSWKIPYISDEFFDKDFIFFSLYETTVRNSVISFSFVNKVFSIYNGKIFITKRITTDMVGLKIGDLAITTVLGNKKKILKKGKKNKK